MKKSFSRVLCLLILFSFIVQNNIVHAAAVSVGLSGSEVKITNNVGKADTIYITGVMAGDIVNVYNAATDGKIIGKATVKSKKTDVTVTIAQLGITAGSVYITVTSAGMMESSRTQIDYSAEYKSEAPLADNIIITNNSSKADTIYISGLAPKDMVKVYTAATEGKLLGAVTVGANKTDVTKSISQLGASGGSVYISVITKGMHESDRIQVNFSAEFQSDALKSKNITITNNSGKSDTIYVTGLAPSDVVKVYTASTGGKVLGTSTVGSQKTEATITLSQLGEDSGSVYISVTSKGMLESSRIYAEFSAEDESDSVSTGNITITNNSEKADTIYVTGLISGDKVTVYNASTGGRVLGSATVSSSDSTATISIAQLGTTSGNVYVSITSAGMLESSREKVSYSAESQSNTIDTSNITVTNSAGESDIVYVSGLTEGDVVKAYSSSDDIIVLGSATVSSSSTVATITISQLGTSAGSIYVSITGTNKLESDRLQVDYSAEGKSSSVDVENIVITNNSGKSDTVYLSELTAGDLVKVYDSASSGNLLGSVTVGYSYTEATVSIAQLGTAAGSIYISITGKGKSESSRVKIDYSAENKSKTLDVNNIVVTNNVGSVDTVQVSNISSSQVVKVYDAAKGGNLLSTATVSAGSINVTITISQLSTEAGSIYISLTDTNKLESDRVQVDYSVESKSDILNVDNISITNKSGSSDTINLTGLSQNDVIKVYDLAKGGNLLGSATVAIGDTKATISIAQLGTSEGSIYVSRISSNKSESDRVKVEYLTEPTSMFPKAENIIITNNAGIADTVQVTGISANDVVNIYDLAKGGNLLGTTTVASTGIEATVSIAQLGNDAGSIYVSITSTNKSESSRTQAGFSAESKSTALVGSKITIVNNAGIAGIVTINGVTGNDVVNVYDSAQGGILIGTGTVGKYDTEVTILVTQLGSEAGSVFVSVTSTGKLESDRTEATYTSKLVSNAPNADNITVENNSGISDTIELSGLQPNDIVKVYDSAQGGDLLGTATVYSSSMKTSVTIAQLGISAGNIYVSVKSTGKIESNRSLVQYNAESQSNALNEGDITIENNAGTSDIIDVTGVSVNDVVKVYSAAQGGTILGTAAVASGDSEAIIAISQLGTNEGSVYISVVRFGKTESSRVKANYLAESTAPVVGNISIVNNAVISDTIAVRGVAANDIVKIYDTAQNGNLLGYAIVAANSQEVTVTISQLTSVSGSVYISVINFGKGESKRTKADYIAEQSSTALYSGNISIANNIVGKADVITVSNLSPNDVIKVYDATSGGNLIGIATVSSNGTQTTINISQLSTSAGSVYISITTSGKNESSRTKVEYIAEN